jgi:hypothetical protein
MKFKEKIMIFMVALLLSVLGFSLIISPSASMLKVGKEAGYEIIENYLAK